MTTKPRRTPMGYDMRNIIRTVLASFFFILSALCIAFAWLTPGSTGAAVLGWCSALSLIMAARVPCRPYLPALAGGIITNLFGFYWLFNTIFKFGGFDKNATLALFALFIVVSALQYVVFIIIYRLLPYGFDLFAIRTATAWTVSEIISVRIFPWYLGHTQLAFTPLSQIADIGGAVLISFVMIWFAETVFRMFIKHEFEITFVFPIAIFFASVAYGFHCMALFSSYSDPKSYKVAIIQGNIGLLEKHSPEQFSANLDHYISLSQKVATPNTLVIWPESALMQWIPDEISNRNQSPELKKLPANTPYLLGALTFSSNRDGIREEIFNSALAVGRDGVISSPYHKSILMPFGEFTPGLSDKFPSNLIPSSIKNWLRETNNTVANFTPGTSPSVFEYSLKQGNKPVYKMKVSPLICYEDVTPVPARVATLKGAELLVNLTNDAWFGNTLAPYQHNTIAAFRAIENRRFLVRATNSGLSAVISPLGKTMSELPPFTSGTLLADVIPLSYKSVYTEYIGEKFNWLLLFLVGNAMVWKIKLWLFKKR